MDLVEDYGDGWACVARGTDTGYVPSTYYEILQAATEGQDSAAAISVTAPESPVDAVTDKKSSRGPKPTCVCAKKIIALIFL